MMPASSPSWEGTMRQVEAGTMWARELARMEPAGLVTSSDTDSADSTL
jgi:hypothetical protein